MKGSNLYTLFFLRRSHTKKVEVELYDAMMMIVFNSELAGAAEEEDACN